MLKLGAGLAALALGFSVQAEVIVDDFNTPQALIVDDANGGTGVSSSVSTGGSGILGGERDIWANAISGAGGAGSNYGTRIGVIHPGYLTFSNDSGVAGMGRVQWDGGDGSIDLDHTGLGGVDLTAGGGTGFQVTTISSDADWNFEIFLYTDADSWTQISFAAHAVPTGSDPAVSYIPFAAFVNPALCGTTGGGVNFINCAAGPTTADITNIGAIDLWLNTPAGTSPIAFDIDLRLDNISVVPEPGALALIGAALAFGSFTLRRRKQM